MNSKLKPRIPTGNVAYKNFVLLSFFNKNIQHMHGEEPKSNYENGVKGILREYGAQGIEQAMKLMESKNEELCKVIDRVVLEKFYFRLVPAHGEYMKFLKQIVDAAYAKVSDENAKEIRRSIENDDIPKTLVKGINPEDTDKIRALLAPGNVAAAIQDIINSIIDGKKVEGILGDREVSNVIYWKDLVKTCEEIIRTHGNRMDIQKFEAIGFEQYVEKVYARDHGVFGIKDGLNSKAGFMLELYGIENSLEMVHWVTENFKESELAIIPPEFDGSKTDQKRRWEKRIDIMGYISQDIGRILWVNGTAEKTYEEIRIAYKKAIIDISEKISDIINGEKA